MTNLTEQTISFKEICYVTELSSQTIIEIVEQGIVSPVGDLPEHWVFNANMVTITKKAYRLHRDLDID